MENPGQDYISAETYFLLLDAAALFPVSSRRNGTPPHPTPPDNNGRTPFSTKLPLLPLYSYSGASGFTRPTTGRGKEKEEEITRGREGKKREKGGIRMCRKVWRPNRDGGRSGRGRGERSARSTLVLLQTRNP